MEAKPVFEKRKRLPSLLLSTKAFGSSSLDSTFGRKPDAKIRRLESSREISKSRHSGRIDVLSRDFVKDLRSHRVFSPSSELYKEMSDQKLGFGFWFDESENDLKAAQSGDLFSEGLSLGGPTGKVDSGSLNSETVDGLGEQCAQKTANSEAMASAGFGVSDNCGNEIGTGKLLSGNAQNNGCVNGDKSVDSDSKTKSFLRPCFQRKVFKTPGSISYRRLLPFLMDISENDSGVGENNQIPQLDKVLEEKKHQAMQASQGDKDSTDGVERNGISVECQNGHSDAIVKSYAIESSRSDELISSENVSLSSSVEVADECSLIPVLNDVQNPKVGLSCEDQKSTNLNIHVPIAVKDSQDARDDIVCISSDDSKPGEYVGTTEHDIQFPCIPQDIETGNTEGIKNIDVEGQKPKQMNDQRGGDHDEVLNEADNLNEESNQMTPPDAEIFGRPEVEASEVERADYVEKKQNRGHFFGKLPSGINHGNASLDCNTRHELNSKCRAVTKPRSQMKLFKSPGSLSYRRMLPFLMNIAKENSDTSANGHCANPQKDLEHTALLASDKPEILSDKLNVFGIEESQKDYSAAFQMAAQTSVKDSSEEKQNLASPEYASVFQTLFISENEELLQVKAVASTIPSELETSPGSSSSVQAVQDTGRPVATLCSSNCVPSSREEVTISYSNQSFVETEGDLSASATKPSNGVKLVEEDKPCYASPQTGVTLVSSVTPAFGPKKGILKRNPRGCRGLCNCLNCASFRLHAERGFEFSRNQMEDAEEMVLDLIKELSHLRNVLEKSADAADNHTVNVDQVKEACRKASEAEVIAKDRLNQMNYDLDIHCRITCLEPPRVRFANRVEENVLSKTGFPGKQVLKHGKEHGQKELNTK